jgi:histidinol-phosphate aminotransferase
MALNMDRRALLGAGGVAMLAATQARAAAVAAPAVATSFGPAAGVALLSRNENPYGPAPSAVAAISSCAGKGCYYADKALERLTAMIAERFGVTPDHVVVASGSTEVLAGAALAYGAKGKILCPELFWDTTVLYGEKKGVKVSRVALAPDMGVDLAALQAALTPDVSLVHICNPNNPTGMALDGNALRAFVRAVGPKTTVLVDEAYIELTDDPEGRSVAALVKEGANLIVCRTFSKLYGMAGLRVGYAICQPETATMLRSYLMSFGGNAAGLAAAIASYDDEAFCRFSKAKVLEARGMMEEAVKRAGLTALPSQANFLFVKVPDADALQKAMAARDIMIRGKYGNWANWSRVSTGRIEDVKRYAAALPELVGA